MSSLSDILLSEANRPAVTADVVDVIEHYIANRGGLRGIGMKAALAMGKATRPDLLSRGIGHLLPEIVAALEPAYAASKTGAGDFETAVSGHRDTVAGKLVATLDRRMSIVQNPQAKSIYKRLSGNAEEEIAALLPSLSRSLAQYLGTDSKPSVADRSYS